MNAHQAAWDAAYQPWAAARREEMAYDRDVYNPAMESAAITAEMEAETDRLLNVRADIEAPIFHAPSLTAEQLATKVLIAFDNGRTADFWMAEILRDCRRFADDSLTRGTLSEGVDAAEDHPFGPPRTDTLVTMLEERNALLSRAETDPPKPDPEDEENRILALVELAAPIEDQMRSTKARTITGLVAKLVLELQQVLEGFEVSEDAARDIVHESCALLGIGAFVNPRAAFPPADDAEPTTSEAPGGAA